jgi:predicted thioesterase
MSGGLSHSTHTKGRCRQLFGRLPWFAFFLRRARRLRPVLLIGVDLLEFGCRLAGGAMATSVPDDPPQNGIAMSAEPTIVVGLTASASYKVAEPDTARWLGSGDLDVLATPRLLGWMEAVTCRALDRALTAEQTSVGTSVSLEHVHASPVGAVVDVVARVVQVDGRRVRLEAVATADEHVCGRSDITRVVVERDRFMQGLSR